MATFILNPNPPTAASCPVQHRQDPGLRTFQAPPATLAPLGGCFPSLAPGIRPHPAQATEILKLPAFLAAPYLYSPLEAASVPTHISTAKDETLQTFLSVPTGPSVSTLTVAFYTHASLLTSQGISLSLLSSHGRALQRALFTCQVTKFSCFQSNVEKVQLLWFYSEAFSQDEAAWTSSPLPFFLYSPLLPQQASLFRWDSSKKCLPSHRPWRNRVASKEKSSATLSITATEWTPMGKTLLTSWKPVPKLCICTEFQLYANIYGRHAFCPLLPHCSSPPNGFLYYCLASSRLCCRDLHTRPTLRYTFPLAYHFSLAIGFTAAATRSSWNSIF